MATPVNPLFERLCDALYRKAETPEKGYKTVEQWAKEWRKSKPRTRSVLNDAKRAGLMKRKLFRIMTSRGLYPIPHYAEA